MVKRRWEWGENYNTANSVTLVVDGKVVDGCFVGLSGWKSTAGEMNMMCWTKDKHSPTVI